MGLWKGKEPAPEQTFINQFYKSERLYRGMPMVRTTDGYLVEWDKHRILDMLVKETELAKTLFGMEPLSYLRAEKIADAVESRIRLIRPKFVSGPMIREMVNNILLDWSEHEELKELQIYRNILSRVGVPIADAYEIDTGAGYESKENANLQPNPETIHKKKADRLSKEQYLLLMNPELATAHHQGDIHIHTLEYFGSRPFCQDWDLRYFLYYGLIPDGTGFRSSVAGPAKQPEVAILHSVKVLAAGQTNFSGGQGFMYYTMFLAPFLRGLPYQKVKQLAQMMFYELTQTYVTRGGQLVFSNIQLPMGVPDIWKNVPVVMKGRIGPDTYGSYEDEVQMFFRAITEVALEGDYWGKPFNFPKNENYVSPEFFKPEYDDLWMLVHESVGKFGAPYFDNMLPAYRGYGNGISCYQCCAYQFSNTPESDPKFHEKLNFDDGQHFSMGGWQVVSLNMPRLAYRANGDYDKLLEAAQENMQLAVDVFKAKQFWMGKAIKNNMVPFATQTPRDPRTGKQGPPAVDFSELVNVIGVVGINEMVQQFTGKQLHESNDAVRVAIKLLLDMEKYRKGLEMRNGFKMMLARTPAESTAQTFAISDLVSPSYKKFAKNIVKGDIESSLALAKGKRDLPVYYSNGTHTYVGAKIPLGQKIDIEHKFFPILSGGNIFHAWLGESCSDPEALYKLTQRICRNSQIGYFSYTKDLTVCSQCQSTSTGMLKSCPTCGSDNVRWWSRITGYYTDVTGWNAGKRQELMDRYRVTL
ncbi:MAG: anaerobic ribonucleoside-triphosphate reductase [Candidatus Bathyarchaeota archaeon]|nr:anaerobic ribonucleoside-triphosphate reductase [Candidatus Bathyarchaeota archaeon]